MALSFYNVGLDALADWETATYQWLLVTGGTFDRTQSTVAEVLSGATPPVTEATVSGYAREAAATKVRTVDDVGDQVTYTAADPNFGTLAAGETVTAVVLIRVVTTDADSIPVGWATLTPTATDALDPFTIDITGGIVAYTDQAA